MSETIVRIKRDCRTGFGRKTMSLSLSQSAKSCPQGATMMIGTSAYIERLRICLIRLSISVEKSRRPTITRLKRSLEPADWRNVERARLSVSVLTGFIFQPLRSSSSDRRFMSSLSTMSNKVKAGSNCVLVLLCCCILLPSCVAVLRCRHFQVIFAPGLSSLSSRLRPKASNKASINI